MGFCKCGCFTMISNKKTWASGHNKANARPQVEVSCSHCNGKFSGTVVAMENRSFCSNECRDAYRRLMVGPLSPSYTSFDAECGICGKTFTTQPGRWKRHQVYCSMECGKEGRRRKISGMSRNTKPVGKYKAKVRDGFACLICGFDQFVHAHHITHKKDGGSNAMTNLITLCPNHHAMAHAGLLTPAEMLDALAKAGPVCGTLVVRARVTINYRAS